LVEVQTGTSCRHLSDDDDDDDGATDCAGTAGSDRHLYIIIDGSWTGISEPHGYVTTCGSPPGVSVVEDNFTH